MKTEMNFKKGSHVFRSDRGTRGFYYPSQDKVIVIKDDCLGLRMSGYLRYGGKSAYSVPTTAICEEDQYLPKKAYMVIWK